MNDNIKIIYVGNKPVKKDTVTRSGVIWSGYGDVQEVEPRVAKALLAYPTVWRIDGEEDAIKPTTTAVPNMPEAGSVHDEKPDDVITPAERHAREAEARKAASVEPAPLDASPSEENKGLEPLMNTSVSLDDVFAKLDRENPNHFSKLNKPKIDAVRELAGDKNLTVDQVAEAWEKFSE